MNEIKVPSKRIEAIDIAKGIGIILVIIGHSLEEGMAVWTIIYSFHMPLFFVLSGLVMKPVNKDESLTQIIMSESRNIISYLLYSIFFFCFDVFVRNILMNSIGMRYLFTDVYKTITLYGINVLWFLSSLILCKIMCRILMIKSNSKRKDILISLLIFICASFIGDHTYSLRRSIYFPTIALLRPLAMMFFVILGSCLKDIFSRIYQWSEKILHSSLLFCIGSIFLGLNIVLWRYYGSIDIHNMVMGSVILTLLVSVTGSISVILISIFIEKIPIIKHGLSYLGINSLFIMVTHNYLLIKTVISNIFIKFMVPELVLTEIVILVFIEGILCLLIARYCDCLIIYLDKKFWTYVNILDTKS